MSYYSLTRGILSDVSIRTKMKVNNHENMSLRDVFHSDGDIIYNALDIPYYHPEQVPFLVIGKCLKL